jgi:hypothetical protein
MDYKKDLKEGDEILVMAHEGIWKKRILLCVDTYGSVIIVACGWEAAYWQGKDYNIYKYPKDQWKPIEKPKLVPFSFEDDLLGRKIVAKANKNIKSMITIQGAVTVDNGLNGLMPYAELLENYEFLDGSPCGKEVPNE